jgi:AraC-like DNA-binding protein
MAEARVDPPKGLLNLSAADGRVTLARYLPGQEVAFFVEHYWIVRWDLRGQAPFTSETLPYPSVHLVLERGRSRIVGVPTGKFEETVQGEGLVFGVKFKPGGFHPLVGGPISRLTNKTVAAVTLLDYAPTLETEVLAVAEDRLMVDRAEILLAEHLPARDEHIPLLTSIVDSVATDRAIVRVEQLVAQFGLGKRTLQRLFHEYVGVTPKWVIQRYRLFEAAEQLAAGHTTGARVAHELGYFDQAHFIRDFKALVGRSPLEFARRAAGPSSVA